MTARLGFIFALGAAMGLALSVTPARADNRPSETPLFQLLNGEVSRDLQSDGGAVTLWTVDAGVACATVRTGGVYEVDCDVAFHWCPWGDGGCSSTRTSQAYGKPAAASTTSDPRPLYFTAQPNSTPSSTKQVCALPASGATLTCSVFRMQ